MLQEPPESRRIRCARFHLVSDCPFLNWPCPIFTNGLASLRPKGDLCNRLHIRPTFWKIRGRKTSTIQSRKSPIGGVEFFFLISVLIFFVSEKCSQAKTSIFSFFCKVNVNFGSCRKLNICELLAPHNFNLQTNDEIRVERRSWTKC